MRTLITLCSSIAPLVATVATVAAAQSVDVSSAMHWREIGPYRGGRSVAATGNPSRPDEFWMGTSGGGVFKSINAGQSWAPVTSRVLPRQGRANAGLTPDHVRAVPVTFERLACKLCLPR